MIRDIPSEERPRERLLEVGKEKLSEAELLAIFLDTGTKGKSVLQLAGELLERFGGLAGLIDASIEEVREVKGIGLVKAIKLQAAFELTKRYNRAQEKKTPLSSVQEAYFALKDRLEDLKEEAIFVLLRDVRGKTMYTKQIALGTLSQVLIHPREVFYPAVRHKAHSFIIAHNHPSGDPTPSQADLEMTQQLLKSSQVMGIPIDDHLIIGKASFVSLREFTTSRKADALFSWR